jgi:alpha-mannosidase
MTTLVSLKNPAFLHGTESARDLAFMGMGLYFEHDFSFGGPGASGAERVQFHRDTEAEVSSYVNTLHTDSATALGTMIGKTGSNLRFYAFNPLSWVRADFADLAYSGSLPVHVVDVSAANAEVPSQIVTVDGTQRIRIWAENIPSLGYKVYEVRHGNGSTNWGTPVTANLNVDDARLENANYKLKVNKRGAIISMEDKIRSNVELAATTAPFLNDLGGSNNGTITIENSGPVSVTLKVDSGQVLTHTSRITLFRSGDRVDIRNDINQALSDPSSGSLPAPATTHRTYQFHFNLSSPDVWHEEAGAVLHAKREPVGHYSDDSARVDWLTANHFMDMTGNANLGVTLSNADSFVFKLGNSTATSLDTTTPLLSLLAVGRMTNENPIHNQAGDSAFKHRYALRSHGGFDQTAAMKFSLEHQNPLVTREVTGTFSGAPLYPSTTHSFVSISDPDVLVWALKPHEDGIGSGVVARTWNMAVSGSTTLDFASNVTTARRLTHTERALSTATVTSGDLNFMAGDQQMQTHLVFFEGQLTGYDAWKAQKFSLPEQGTTSISGPNADPDGDGSENLQEYAFATEPKIPQASQTPTSEVTVNHQKYLAISFPQRSDALDVVYVIRSSPDLQNWTDMGSLVGGEGAGVSFMSSSGIGTTTTVLARDLLPLSDGPRRFLKVEVRR